MKVNKSNVVNVEASGLKYSILVGLLVSCGDQQESVILEGRG